MTLVELASDTSSLQRSTPDDHYEATTFLVDEAETLDRGAYRAWLDLLSEDIVYRLPVRVTVAHTLANSFLDMDHLLEDRYSLEKRVERFETDHAWTEDPPSRTRRFVTNVRVWVDAGGRGLVAKSYLLLFRSRGDMREPDWISAERMDHLLRTETGLKLAERLVTVDESVLRTQNLAVFL